MRATSEELTIFIAVVESQSFSRAAERLHLANSAVSRSVKKLEQKLGVSLLNRTTRQLSLTEVSAMFLLIPGAMLVSMRKGKDWAGHVALKTFSALLFSCYYSLWQYAAQGGPFLNNLIWDRIGAAGVILLALAVPIFRKRVFSHTYVKQKNNTAGLFIFKQILGGANFVLLSFLFAVGKISVINSLQGFRYVFLLFLGAVLTKKRGHLLSEEYDRRAFWQKSFGILLVFIGTVILFI